MNVKTWLLAILTLLSGCASFSIAPLSPDKPEQVWQVKAVEINWRIVEQTRLFSAVIVTAPDHWVRSERSGTLPVGPNKRIAVTRNAWRAIAFFSDGSELKTSALLGPDNYLVVLLPGVSESRARSARIIILSGLSAFALDVSGHEYGSDAGFDMEQLLQRIRKGVIPLPLPMAIENLNPGTEQGDIFSKKFLTMFPEEKIIDGRAYRISRTAPEGLERATHGYLSPDDRIASNAELFLTPGGMGALGAGEAVIRTLYNMGTARPQGPYRLPDIQTQSPEREKVGDQ